jgi:hypothetical protein
VGGRGRWVWRWRSLGWAVRGFGAPEGVGRNEGHFAKGEEAARRTSIRPGRIADRRSICTGCRLAPLRAAVAALARSASTLTSPPSIHAERGGSSEARCVITAPEPQPTSMQRPAESACGARGRGWGRVRERESMGA